MQTLHDLWINDVIIDDGSVADQIKDRPPFTKILELVGITTLQGSLKCSVAKGTVCMTGIVGNKWTFEQFSPMASIPTTVRLATYAGGSQDLLNTPIEDIVRDVVSGKMHLPVKSFPMGEIVEAHPLMEETGPLAKIVMLT